jgi:hypothetical protein
MRVGITGHQKIDAVVSIWLLDQLRVLVQDTPGLVGVSSLAEGADQLFAEVVLIARRPLEVVLPFAEYVEVFSNEVSRATYETILKEAAKTVTLPRQSTDELSFLEAGRHIVRDTASMVAIWDGKPAKGVGGTADIVDYALSLGRPILHLDPVARVQRWLGSTGGA